MDLPRGFSDRLFQGVTSLVIAACLVPFMIAAFYADPDDWVLIVVKYAAQEVLLLFFSIFVLMFVWCLCTPAWVERLVARRARMVMLAATLLIVGLTVALVGQTYIDSFG